MAKSVSIIGPKITLPQNSVCSGKCQNTKLTTINVKGDKPNNYYVKRIDNDVFWDVTPYTLVDMYRHLGSKTTPVSSLHKLIFISLSREP